MATAESGQLKKLLEQRDRLNARETDLAARLDAKVDDAAWKAKKRADQFVTTVRELKVSDEAKQLEALVQPLIGWMYEVMANFHGFTDSDNYAELRARLQLLDDAVDVVQAAHPGDSVVERVEAQFDFLEDMVKR